MSPRSTRPREGSPDQRIRAKRIEVGGPLVVESRTIGAPMTYAMPTENLSRTGLLLNAGRNLKVPFQVNTLLELTIDPQGYVFERPVQCLGKIVRVAQDRSQKNQYGIQIIQMEVKDLASWERTVGALESGEVRLLPAMELEA